MSLDAAQQNYIQSESQSVTAAACRQAVNTTQSTKVTPGHLRRGVPRLGFRQVQMTCIIFKISSIYTEWNTLFKKTQHFSLLLFNKFDHLSQQSPLRPHLWTWHRKWKQNHWRRSWKHYKGWNVNSKQNTEQTNQQQAHRTTASSHGERQQSLFAKQQEDKQ